jgi:antitoxin CptB
MTGNETHQERVRRLIYRSSYTGMKETDLLLGQFARTHLAALSTADLDDYETLLAAGDPAILAFVQGQAEVPPELYNRVLILIRQFDASRQQDREDHADLSG